MTFLGPDDGMIQVRLVKPPFDATPRVYFDEYEKPGNPYPHKASYECTRTFVPEDTTYAIEVTLKQGFKFGKYVGLDIKVYDKASEAKLGGRGIRKDDFPNVLQKDEVKLIDTLDDAIVDGASAHGVSLTLFGLKSDDKLVEESDVMGISVAALGSIQVRLHKCTEAKLETANEDEWNERLRQHQAQLSAKAEMVDHESFHKSGITQSWSRRGNDYSLKQFSCPNENDAQSLEGYFVQFRVSQPLYVPATPLNRNPTDLSAFLERSDMMKCPIPLEWQPWACLSKDDQPVCFKALQACDKEHTVMQRVNEAGPDADASLIRREVLELGDVPNRWRSWGSLLKREKPALFQELQARRQLFEKGEYPAPAGVAGDAKPIIQQQLTLPLSLPLPKSTPEPAATSTIKIEPREALSTPRAPKSQSEIIILNDSPPPRARTATAAPSNASHATIKHEMIDIDVAPQAKRVKVEHEESTVCLAKPGEATKDEGDDDSELAKLREEDERIEQELLAAQRVADLMRQRNDKKRGIAALEARKR